jgi:flavin reductase (DIM6/NTAB) family NADH-FMN oxidoreductase RutF
MADKRSLGARTLLYPSPVLVVGTYDAEDNPDIMTVAWGGICCSKPPCVAVSIRAGRLSHANIMHHQAFTVNLPAAHQVAEADFVGTVSGRDVDKFAATGLTAVRAEHVHAPCVAEFPIALECRVVHIAELGAHTMFVGEILDAKVDEEALGPDGKVDIDGVGFLTYIPGEESYRGLGPSVGEAFSVGKKFKVD